MTNPNQTQAINLLRRLRSDSTRPEAEEAAKALIGQIQAQGAMLTVKGVLRTAVAASPNDDASTAVQKMTEQVAMSFCKMQRCSESSTMPQTLRKCDWPRSMPRAPSEARKFKNCWKRRMAAIACGS